jgi:hypothetical protein
MQWEESPLYAKQKQAGTVPGHDIAKLEQAIQVHGYRGASKKKHNGVVPITARDKKLWQFYNNNQQLVPAQYQGGLIVKAVAHVPNGDRLVGVMNPAQTHMFVLGLENYT